MVKADTGSFLPESYLDPTTPTTKAGQKPFLYAWCIYSPFEDAASKNHSLNGSCNQSLQIVGTWSRPFPSSSLILYYAIPYYTILYYTLLYSTILYSTILYSTIL